MVSSITCDDRVIGQQCQEQGSESLLSVQDESFGLWRACQSQAFDESRLEPDIGIAGLEHHYRPDRERQ